MRSSRESLRENNDGKKVSLKTTQDSNEQKKIFINQKLGEFCRMKTLVQSLFVKWIEEIF